MPAYVVSVSFLGEWLRRLGDREGAAIRFVEALVLAVESRLLTHVPDVLEGVAGLFAPRAPYRAAVLLGAAAAARTGSGIGVYYESEQAVIEQAVRENLDSTAFESARAKGLTLPVDDAAAYALETLDHSRAGQLE
jgi:hypothetical protein